MTLTLVGRASEVSGVININSDYNYDLITITGTYLVFLNHTYM